MGSVFAIALAIYGQIYSAMKKFVPSLWCDLDHAVGPFLTYTIGGVSLAQCLKGTSPFFLTKKAIIHE